jgi:hypothetical protein
MLAGALGMPGMTSMAMAQAPAFPLGATDAAAGWTSLSGSTDVWRGYKAQGFPAKGWTMKHGVLTHAAGGGGGDIMTKASYADFELALQYRLESKANSGIMYRTTEKHDAPWMTAPEMQVFDDLGAGNDPLHWHSAGGMYELYAPAKEKVNRPAGEWNDVRIYMREGRVQHWLNGVKVVDGLLFDGPGLPTKDWLSRIAASKFKAYEGFGLQPSGGITLQDHGDEVSYRNIAVRDLAAPGKGEVTLFNGKDLAGWVPFVPDAEKEGIKPESVWSVVKEPTQTVLVCKGQPIGYIRTEAKYTNFILRLQWRFPADKKPGNSGVLVRVIGEDTVWPKSVEAQLHSGNAGDFWNIGGFGMTTDESRTKGRNTKKTHNAERPLGEWNEYEIVVDKGLVVLRVNGEELNRATNVDVVAGHIALQSEGAEIHFKNVRLVPLGD